MRDIEISASDARDLTDRIKVGVEAIWELIKQAYQSRAWAALGYDSWDDYCTREFGTSRIRLPREERQEVVASMREIGMSVRAIASATGTNRETIRQEVSGDRKLSPAPVTGTDGKTYTPRPASQPERPEPEPEHADKPVSHDRKPTEFITPDQLDALNTPPERADKPRAEPITNRFTAAVLELTKSIDRLHRLERDTNFKANKNQIATLHRNDLARATNELQQLTESLTKD